MSIVYIYELDISLYFYVSFSSSIKLKPTINFMGNFKYNLFLCVCCNSIMCIREMFSLLCFQRAYFTKKKKSYFDRTECCVNSSKSGTTEIPEAPLLLMS